MRLATSAKSKGLSDFVVEDEPRYWVHPPSLRFGEAGVAIESLYR
jgi:hypothetical protein